MQFPYGISDFYSLIKENYFYVDRTDRIPSLEQAGKQLLFLRPRRFGKSLLLSMLANYYDVAKADEFTALFGHLAIGQQPTDKHNRYIIMTWDFSKIEAQGTTEQLRAGLYGYLNTQIRICASRYANYLTHPVLIDEANALLTLDTFLASIQASGYQLYLFIDEYDNFANEVMAAQVRENKRYAELVYGEGLLKTVFKNIKAAASGNGLDRVFITGVSPVVMADISSGYNVVENIYRRPEFNDLCGFTEAETREMLQHVIAECAKRQQVIDFDTTYQTIKQFYNGYCFNQRDLQSIYNPTLLIYFLKDLAHDCQYPDELLDNNLAMDRNRISDIAQLPHGAQLIENALDASQPLLINKLHDRFGVQDMLQSEKSAHELASLLYYLGVLTQDSVKQLGKLQLRIPNLVIRSLYIEKLRDILLPEFDYTSYLHATEIFFTTGNLQPICDVLEPRFNVFSNRDYKWANEIAVKTAFLMLLFDDRLYVIDSEPELKRCYADMTLIARPDTRHYEMLDHLLEFKFVKLTDLNLTGVEVQEMTVAALRELDAVQTAFTEAAAQLARYQQVLQHRYGALLRLQTTVVVAVGFERLLWETV